MPSESPRHRPLRLAGVATLSLLLAACTPDLPLDSLDPQGPAARQIDNLFWLTFWIATAIFVLVEGAILVAVVVFRDRPSRTREPKQVHGNAKLEVVWTVIPALILTGIAVPTVRTVFDLTSCEADALPVEVIGHQWWFEYHYPQADVTTANVLVIPAGRQVCLDMTSEDVMHNFWIPKLNGKRYLIPGQQTTLTLEADEPGEYWGQCGEFCGLSHAIMRARVEALPESEFETWLVAQQAPAAEPAADSLAATGKEAFLGGACVTCHVIGGVNEVENAIGPDLTHFASRSVFGGASFETNAANLTAWLADPPAMKPGSLMPNLNLTNDDITALIAYLETLQ